MVPSVLWRFNIFTICQSLGTDSSWTHMQDCWKSCAALGSCSIQIYKLLIFSLFSYFPSCTFMTQLWWLLLIFSTPAHPSRWLSHYISIVYLTQIKRASLQKEPFDRAPVLPSGLWLRHWHGKQRFTPTCYESWGGSSDDQFAYPHPIKFCCLEMFWTIGNNLMWLFALSQILWETCAFPQGQLRVSWAMLRELKETST